MPKARCTRYIFYLTAFGYVDSHFDRSEKTFIRDYLAKLVIKRADEAPGNLSWVTRDELVSKWTVHFHEVLDSIDSGIQADFAAPEAEGEDAKDSMIARLKLHCFELIKGFNEGNQQRLLKLVDELMLADGVVHPNERKFRDELFELINAPMELALADLEPLEPEAVVVGASVQLSPRKVDHPFFSRTEFDDERDPQAFRQQAANDLNVVDKTMAKINEQRPLGKGRLGDAVDVKEFAKQEPCPRRLRICASNDPQQG